uniref:glutamate--tRNA ligase n=1 Tax=Leptocylindrus danicus TaxID=163516 RepID=A0A7S2PKZ2_9STRA|mmetsp:Transcript_4314/g.6281  ORF Transcript_4314/g.6281 Transcript_4314/m.6281 type:complete len:811 (+) Transcript_4314:1406-3838(+)
MKLSNKSILLMILCLGARRAAAFTSHTPKFTRAFQLKSTAETTELEQKVAKLFSKEKGSPRLRFAPSPTGSLHVGGARTALYNWLLAQQAKLDEEGNIAGKPPGFVLRVEDTDVARSTKESEASVMADLKWLGLNWEEGPDMESDCAPYRQSERMNTGMYETIADYLIENDKAYKCFCTPEELEELKAIQEREGASTRSAGPWRNASPEQVEQALAEGKPHTVRFKTPDGSRVIIEDAVRGTVAWDASGTIGDFILLRSSGMPVYNFCVAVDDANMGISTVIRAEEHLTNTLRQVLILDALGAPRPQYAHCSLILGQDKQKLSKRHGATSCTQFKEDGYLPDAMINYLSLLGWNDGTSNEIFTRDELIECFTLDRVVKSPAVFDMDKLNWVNAQHLKKMSIEETTPFVSEFMEKIVTKKDVNVEKMTEAATILAKKFMETTVAPVTNMREVLDYQLPAHFDQLDEESKTMVEKGHFYQIASQILKDFNEGAFPSPTDLGIFYEEKTNEYNQAYQQYMKSVSKVYKTKGQLFYHPVRLALTGVMSGQEIPKQLSMMNFAKNIEFSDEVAVKQMEERMQMLSAFLDTIPAEFKEPKQEEPKEAAKPAETATAAPVAATAAPTTEGQSSSGLESYDGPAITSLDIRVGEIKECWNHEEADRLFCESVDLGEVDDEGKPKLRSIASGLREFYENPEDLVGRKVLVLANLKERKLVGFPSHGMLLCASNEEHTEVQLISPPVDAKIGERITIPSIDFEGESGTPMKENPLQKKKVLEKILPFLTTSKYGVPEFCGLPFMTSAGVCTSSINDGTVG